MANQTQPKVDLLSSKPPSAMLLKCSWTVESRMWGSRQVLISEGSPLHGEMVFCVAAKILTAKYLNNGQYWHHFVLFFGGVNLHKPGLIIKAIEVRTEGPVYLESPSGCITYMITENVIQKGIPLQVFSRKYLKNVDESCRVVFNFRILVESKSESLAHCLRDETLVSQLWGACSRGPPSCDVVIEAKGSTKFHAHRAILAARSPVFAEMFKPTGAETVNSSTSSVTVNLQVEADSTSVQKFLKFLYTGGLEDSSYADKCLLQLAKRYQVASLEKTCVAAIGNIDDGELNVSIIKMFAKDGAVVSEVNKPVVFGSQSVVTSDNHSVYYSCGWDIYEKLENEGTLSSGPFFYRDIPLFTVAMHAKNGNYYYSFKRHAAGIEAFRIVKAYYSWHRAEVACGTWESLGWSELESKGMDSTRSPVPFLGKLMDQPTGPFHLHFLLELSTNEINNFSHGMMDVNWFKDMSSCLNGPFCDVEISCHSEKYFAHRAVLSARSPAFAAKFSSTSTSTDEKSSIVMDEEPLTVLHFLRFLYTGLIPHSVCIEKRKDLDMLAIRYQVKSLRSWLSNYAVKTEANPLVAVFSSLALY